MFCVSITLVNEILQFLQKCHWLYRQPCFLHGPSRWDFSDYERRLESSCCQSLHCSLQFQHAQITANYPTSVIPHSPLSVPALLAPACTDYSYSPCLGYSPFPNYTIQRSVMQLWLIVQSTLSYLFGSQITR